MKQKKAVNLSQIIIYVLLTVLVLGVYLIDTIYDNRLSSMLSAATPEPSPSSIVETIPPVGIPAKTLLTALNESGLSLVEGETPFAYTLRDPEGMGRMRLMLSEEAGYISALTLDFPMPEPLPDQTGKASHYNALTQEHSEQEMVKARDSLEHMIFVLSNAISDSSLSSDAVIRWYDGAADSLVSGKSFQSKDGNLQFSADPAITTDGRSILRISIHYR